LNYFNYFTDIEETFIRRRGKHLLLSPLDWALIESWQEKGIPLKVVLRGIENVFDAFDKNPQRARTIKSLTYCRDEVESLYAAWLETQVGKNGRPEKTTPPTSEKEPEAPDKTEIFPVEAVEHYLEHLGRSIELAKAGTDGKLRRVLEEVEEKIFKYKREKTDAERLESALNELENLIDRTLLETCDKKSLSGYERRIEKELAKYKAKMEPEAYRKTFELMLLKNLREKAEIPRISLFYL
jgi:hypothetical protein